MTLIITRITKAGIAMVADSAVTSTDPLTQCRTVSPSATQKLCAIRGLAAGVSCWGRGTINGEDTSQWLQAFMDTVNHSDSIPIFASRLAAELNNALYGQLNGTGTLGFHVAGYERQGNGLIADLWHVHDGPSDVNAGVDVRKVNANHDLEKFSELRNGEFQPYTVIRESLGQAFYQLHHRGWPSLDLKSLDELAAYGALEVVLMSEIYALSNAAPVIGGRIDCLTICPQGNVRTGKRNPLSPVEWNAESTPRV